MKRKISAHGEGISSNKTYRLLTLFYIVFLFIISFIACYFSYQKKQTDIFSSLNAAYSSMSEEIQDMILNFWQVYMPVYEDNNANLQLFNRYFSQDNPQVLTPFERQRLMKALQSMLVRDDRLQWIALYNEYREDNYILYASNNFTLIPEDFPYLDSLEDDTMLMQIQGDKSFSSQESEPHTIVLSGNAPTNTRHGKLLAAYSISSLEQIFKRNAAPLDSLCYQFLMDDKLIFSFPSQEKVIDEIDPVKYSGVINTPSGLSYIHAELLGQKPAVFFYSCSWWELFVKSHGNTLYILSIVGFFALLIWAIYVLTFNRISKEVHSIQEGLLYISDNHLDYRLPTRFHQSGLSEIASSINHMSALLEENINRLYYYELKQKEGQLEELWSKFNPHFLYNCLEMLRSRCYQNNDYETANLINQLSTIFRSLISSKTFIPLSQELSFSEHYLALLKARYEDMLKIYYDFDSSLFEYGIIRNVFQPLIENYFVHGFDAASDKKHFLRLHGESLDEKTMLLAVEDNGNGMSDLEIEALNNRLHEPIQIETESYGLKNLHQRLYLFYGEDCGLNILHGQEGGLRVEIKVLKWKCEDVVSGMHASGNFDRT